MDYSFFLKDNNNSMIYKWIFILALLFAYSVQMTSQEELYVIKKQIERFKEDPRGPYKDIRWFCPDGTTRDAKDPCPTKDGYQRARYKDEVIEIGKKHRIYLGQILKGNTKEEFFDEANQHSKAKQYVIENFLYNNNDGWILQKAQFYRGAIQAEDEESWGMDFLLWMLDQKYTSQNSYYLMRELSKYIPHGKENNQVIKIRAISKNISDRVPSFMSARTKIHGNPQRTDIQLVEKYIVEKGKSLSKQDSEEIQVLLSLMKTYYNRAFDERFVELAKRLDPQSIVREEMLQLAQAIKSKEHPTTVIIRGVEILSKTRTKILEKRSAKSRLELMDLSIELESYLLSIIPDWKSTTVSDVLEKSCWLGQMLHATGYVFDWEYEQLLPYYTSIPEKEASFVHLYSYYKAIRRHINWSSGIIDTEFSDEVRRFAAFEPLSNGFIDDRIRSSALLHLGSEASSLYSLLVKRAGWENRVLGKVSSSIQGINPGYAKGVLKIVDALDEQVDPKAIYVFRNPPSDLEPVAGILSIAEGNLVSHLQLLARNLGIPNANITEALYKRFKEYEGKEIFYAVSNRGGVNISLASDMTEEEKQLFSTKKIDEEIVTVPIDQMELSDTKIYSLRDIDASSSGILCGPKAANFARLKKLFPEHLVDGLVISFAIFKEHMLQQVPKEKFTYWEYLNDSFDEAERLKNINSPEEQIQNYLIARLQQLSSYIKEMPLKESFIDNLTRAFKDEFDKELGEVPVFLRSDTNMEDLKDFTGAGLNLTVFNTIKRDKILQGVRDVWASPYSERSYKWRQKYLTNPQDVYPSILVIPSVFVDYSGVIISKDFAENQPGRINLALSQGVGGAVDGQKSESWVLSPYNDDILVAPARDANFKRLSRNGGTEKARSDLSTRILTESNEFDIWTILYKIFNAMPKTGMLAPYDIELGFEKGKMWLFQIRPFVENKKATSSIYLTKLDPIVPENKIISLADEIN